jgi:RimJ/RimL family protein N-acetyltransferase
MLEPLTPLLLPELFTAIGHPIVFAGGYGGGPLGYRDNLPDFIDFALGYYPFSTGNSFAVRLVGGKNDGQLVGTSTLAEFEPQHEAVHLGWTAYHPRAWGTAVNAETKLLLLGLAFDSGFGRVKIQADSINERSCAAIAGIGATFEGIRRRDRQRADGSWRDSAVYSVIVDDWPRVSAGLSDRLRAFGPAPVELGAGN